jgi:biopolymer transport protein TolR
MIRGRSMPMIGSLESTTVNVSPRWRSKFRSNHLICHIDVSAFLAVMFALVFLFMSPIQLYIDMPRGTVDAAKVRNPRLMRAALKEDALIVAVQRDGRVFMGVDALSAQDLPSRIHEGIKRGAENRVYIRADARAKYGAVKEVLDQVHASGVENIAFLTDQRRPPASQ